MDVTNFDFSGSPAEDMQFLNFIKERTEERLEKPESVVVYLAGPIEAELSDADPHSIRWRERIKYLFEIDDEITWDVRDPNKGKTDGKKYVRILENEHWYNPYVLFRSDITNIEQSDFVVANLSNFSYGIGTPFEIGFAYAKSIPVICICDPDNPPTHPFITQSVETFVHTEEEAVNILKFLYAD